MRIRSIFVFMVQGWIWTHEPLQIALKPTLWPCSATPAHANTLIPFKITFNDKYVTDVNIAKAHIILQHFRPQMAVVYALVFHNLCKRWFNFCLSCFLLAYFTWLSVLAAFRIQLLPSLAWTFVIAAQANLYLHVNLVFAWSILNLFTSSSLWSGILRSAWRWKTLYALAVF